MSYISSFFEKFAVFNPKGFIAMQQKELIIIAVLLMLIIVIPFFIMTFVIVRKYSAKNVQNNISPVLESKASVILIWWTCITFIILILSVITWNSTHRLDPYKAINSDVKPITIQVIALEWKWLFLYPEQHIATVNFIQVPVDTPIHFILTSDASMNSMWIPQLGGQIYSMPGMSTQLNLIANETGDFRGAAAEINGPGFAGMNFTVRSSSQADFDAWVLSTKSASHYLSNEEYKVLAKPSEKNEPIMYSGYETGLYNSIVEKYMMPMDISTSAHNTHANH